MLQRLFDGYGSNPHDKAATVPFYRESNQLAPVSASADAVLFLIICAVCIISLADLGELH